MKSIAAILPALLLMLISTHSHSDDLTDAAQALCVSVKSCALEQVAAQQELTDEIREKMAPMLDNLCTEMRNQVKSVPVNHALYQPAVGCLRSMVSLDCQQMQSPGAVQTPECTEYNELARPADSAK